ncbi:MAG: hypothetical protein ACSHXB_14920 [Sulfitobacter sp.]
MPSSDPFASLPSDSEPRSFVLRVRIGTTGMKARLVITVDDVALGRKAHFPSLEAAFADIRKALNPPETSPGQPH